MCLRRTTAPRSRLATVLARIRSSSGGLALAAALAVTPAPALAAACCMSATSFGVGRLTIWEDAAVGLRLGHARSLGQWSPAGDLELNAAGYRAGMTTAEPWAILRLQERVQLQAWAPLLLEDREAGATRQLAGGLGDVGAAVRTELVTLGRYQGLPSLAVTVGGIAPTGRRVEATRPPLFAGTTGRGAWAATVAVEAEYASLPWYGRVDLGATLPVAFRRADLGVWQRYGPAVQVALSAGRELVASTLVVSAAVTAEWEGAMRLGGATVPSSRARSLGLASSVSWSVDPHWTLVGTLTNTAWPFDAGMNRDARTGFTLGVRHGFF
jgi:hypothetical protein